MPRGPLKDPGVFLKDLRSHLGSSRLSGSELSACEWHGGASGCRTRRTLVRSERKMYTRTQFRRTQRQQVVLCLRAKVSELARRLEETASLAGSGMAAEVHSRLECIKPVITEQVTAAAEGRRPAVSGATRLRRNVAEHVFGS